MHKILVTGADGFIGSHLTEMLLQQGYSVKALSLGLYRVIKDYFINYSIIHATDMATNSVQLHHIYMNVVLTKE